MKNRIGLLSLRIHSERYSMKKTIRLSVQFLLITFIFFTFRSVQAQENEINNAVVSFQKHELKNGFVFGFGTERDESRTDETRLFKEQSIFNATYSLENSVWNLLDYKQEKLNYHFDFGPIAGSGNWIDSAKVGNTDANHNLYGLRAAADIRFWSRFYYDPKSFSLIDVRATGSYDFYKQNSSGTTVDSLGVSAPLDEKEWKDNLRYGLEAKAGFGFGRLSPMNHLMTAHYLLEKYYPGRVFSDYEIARFAQVIANLKHDRNVRSGHDEVNEVEKLAEFVREQLVLESPQAMQAEWKFGEFDPRYEGTRVEMGPFFNYYNREPDFVYGGFVQFDWDKYQDVKWNRNLGVNLIYNRYKEQDWMIAELKLGWSYYSNLRSQFDFGIRYIPGIELNGFNDIGPVSHNVIPYFSWYSQLNASSRIRFDFAWRIADGEQFVLPGPEFSLAFYRSRY